jgi:hypothetical protein
VTDERIAAVIASNRGREVLPVDRRRRRAGSLVGGPVRPDFHHHGHRAGRACSSRRTPGRPGTGPGERVNAELKNWRILRKIRSCPSRAAELVAAVQSLMITSA